MSAKVLQFPFEPAYTQQLHSYLKRRMRNPSDVDDVIQEAYLRYLRVPESFRIMSPDKYIFIIAANLVAERGKQAAASRVLFSSAIADARGGCLHEQNSDACEEIIAQEELRRVLDRIPQAYREVLILSKRDGLAYHEIASRLGLTPSTVLTYLKRATQFARVQEQK